MTEVLSLQDLKIERLDDDSVMLEQGGYGDGDDRIQLHRSQVALIAEMFGLIDRVDSCSVRETARLRRQMLLLHGRVEQLHHWLAELSDHRNADLTSETLLATALLDLTAEFVADFTPNATERDRPQLEVADVPRPSASVPRDPSGQPASAAPAACIATSMPGALLEASPPKAQQATHKPNVGNDLAATPACQLAGLLFEETP